MSLNVGLGGVRHHACAAVSDARRILGVCEQERLTRIRGAGCNPTGLPDEALDAILTHAGSARSDVQMCAVAEDAGAAGPWPAVRFDHLEAHACTAYLTSPFDRAAVLICDHQPVGMGVWVGEGSVLTPIDWPWSGPTPSDIYSECARLFDFAGDGADQRFEAFARLTAACPDPNVPAVFKTDGTRIEETFGWRSRILERLEATDGSMASRSRIAAALQAQVADVLVEMLDHVRKRTGAAHLCVGGSVFYHSSINTAVRQSELFDRVFVPSNPGNAGLSVGSAMRVAQLPPTKLSPFMGPSYDPDTIKWTLDNCKLSYSWVEEAAALEIAVRHLQQGRLVGWFEGRMEWGPRALGARSILASPFSPYVLENLSRFLKRREVWRGYALTTTPEAARAHFSGPDESPFMECDYRPLDVERFRPVLPSQDAAIRVQTATDDCPPRFRALLAAFGAKTGLPCLVNTSFNGFHEPIVCTPRDAVRVFFGSGLDVLVLDRFVLTK